MHDDRPAHGSTLTTGSDQPLISIVAQEDGREVVRYFTDEGTVDAETSPASVQRALDLAGAWSDMDWDEMEAALDRIRHESPPTPPIDL